MNATRASTCGGMLDHAMIADAFPGAGYGFGIHWASVKWVLIKARKTETC